MFFYIRSGTDFKIKDIAESMDYSLVIGSIYGDFTRITFPSSVNVTSGDFIMNDYGFICIVESVDKNDEMIEVDGKDINNLFNRQIVYDGSEASTSVEAYLMDKLTENFITVSDTYYRIPFLTLAASTTTVASSKPDVEEGIYNLKSYISKTKRLYGVGVTYTVSGANLLATINQKTTNKNLFLDTSVYKITEETFAESVVAKITAINTDTNASQNYYLLSNGSFTTDMTDPDRVKGQWVILTYDDNTIPEESVMNKFKENIYSHKVTFISDEKNAIYDYYDYVKVRLNDNIYDSYVAKKVVNSDGTTEYQLGELRNTFTSQNYKNS